MAKSSGNTTTSKTDPWSPAQPYIKKAMEQADVALGKTPNTPYTGQYFARPNATQQQAVAGVVQQAPGLGTGANELRSYGQDLVAGKYLSPDSNPWVKAMAEASTRDATDNFTRNALPSMNSSAIAQGAYGGSKNGIATALLGSETDKNIRDTYANIYGNNYAQERQYQDNAGHIFGQANELALAPSKALAAAGDTMNQWDDQLIQEAYQKYQDSIKAPWNGLQQFSSIVNGTGGSSSSTTTPSVPWWQQGLQAGLSGLSALGTWWA